MEFVAKVRKVGDSSVVTVPFEIIDYLKINEGDVCRFEIEKGDD